VGSAGRLKIVVWISKGGWYVAINASETIGGLLQLEDDLNLFSQKIDGVYFWERIRFSVFKMILQHKGVVGQAHMKIAPTIAMRFMSAFNAVNNVFSKNPFTARTSDMLFWGSSRRKFGEDQKWHDIYCDLIIKNLKCNYVYVEQSYLGKHLSPAATQGIYYLDFPFFVATIMRKLGFVRVKIDHHEVNLIKKINKRIMEEYGLDVGLHEIIYRSLLNRKSQLPIFKLLLKRIQPKVITIVCSYGKESFIEAGKAMNIPVVELQHGFIGPSHFGYSFPGRKRIKHFFPDYLLTYGKVWNTIAEYPIDASMVIGVGYPYLEKEMQNYIGIEQKEQIVFISQGSVGKQLSKLAIELSNTVNFRYKVIYKLHPNEYERWRIDYPWLNNSKILVIDNDSYPLYKIFAESRVQVGVSSTAIFEGLAFGLQTILVPLGKGIEGMQHLLDNNMATIAINAEEMLEIVNNVKLKYQYDMNVLFKKGSLDNIEKFYNELLNKN